MILHHTGQGKIRITNHESWIGSFDLLKQEKINGEKGMREKSIPDRIGLA